MLMEIARRKAKTIHLVVDDLNSESELGFPKDRPQLLQIDGLRHESMVWVEFQVGSIQLGYGLLAPRVAWTHQRGLIWTQTRL